jgi:pimeloyl-ACP methyl ester carboxylesterase
VRAALAIAACAVAVGAAHAAELKKPIALQKSGSGPAIVFIHGLGGDASVWSDVVARLRDRFTVATVELPGHGASGAPSDGRIDVDRIAAQVADVVKQEQLAPAVIVGHSIGALVAARVPLADPSTTRAVVLVDGFLARLPFPAADRAELRRALQGSRDQALRNFYGRVASSPAQAERVARAATKVAPDLFVGYLDWAADHELGDRGAALTMPVALFGGAWLLEAPVEDAARTKEALRRAGLGAVTTLTVERFANSKHWLWWDEPERFHSALEAFLARLPPLPPPPEPTPPPKPKRPKRR